MTGTIQPREASLHYQGGGIVLTFRKQGGSGLYTKGEIVQLSGNSQVTKTTSPLTAPPIGVVEVTSGVEEEKVSIRTGFTSTHVTTLDPTSAGETLNFNSSAYQTAQAGEYASAIILDSSDADNTIIGIWATPVKI